MLLQAEVDYCDNPNPPGLFTRNAEKKMILTKFNTPSTPPSPLELISSAAHLPAN